MSARVEGVEERPQSRHESAPLPSVGVGPRGLHPLRDLARVRVRAKVRVRVGIRARVRVRGDPLPDLELLLRCVLQPVEPHLELVYRHLVRG